MHLGGGEDALKYMELGFLAAFCLLSQIYFLFLSCIAWREKMLPFFLRKEEFLIIFS